MEDLPPRFRQIISDNVAQSFDDAYQNNVPAALQLMIRTTVTDALAVALPPLLTPMNDMMARMDTKLTRVETKLTRVDTKLTNVETKLTRVEITQAKVSVPDTYLLRTH
jgi:hypothetical protein